MVEGKGTWASLTQARASTAPASGGPVMPEGLSESMPCALAEAWHTRCTAQRRGGAQTTHIQTDRAQLARAPCLVLSSRVSSWCRAAVPGLSPTLASCSTRCSFSSSSRRRLLLSSGMGPPSCSARACSCSDLSCSCSCPSTWSQGPKQGWQGEQRGKSFWAPRWHWSQRGPVKPGRQVQPPLARSHCRLSAPAASQSQAVGEQCVSMHLKLPAVTSLHRFTLTPALALWVAPVVLLAMGTDTAPEARPADALPRELCGGQRVLSAAGAWAPWHRPCWPGAHGTHQVAAAWQGMVGVAGAGLAAVLPAEVPGVRGAAVAVPAHHVGTAGAVARGPVAVAGAGGAVGGQRSLLVTGAACREGPRAWLGDTHAASCPHQPGPPPLPVPSHHPPLDVGAGCPVPHPWCHQPSPVSRRQPRCRALP